MFFHRWVVVNQKEEAVRQETEALQGEQLLRAHVQVLLGGLVIADPLAVWWLQAAVVEWDQRAREWDQEDMSQRRVRLFPVVLETLGEIR